MIRGHACALPGIGRPDGNASPNDVTSATQTTNRTITRPRLRSRLPLVMVRTPAASFDHHSPYVLSPVSPQRLNDLAVVPLATCDTPRS
jgi:hypothetical protein